MPQTIKCRDGSVWIDERLTVEEWLAKEHGSDVKLEGLALSGESLIATISYPESIFPHQNVKVKFVSVPDDVLFRLPQVQQKEFMKIYYADRESGSNHVFVKKTDGKFEEVHEFDPAPSLALVNHSPTGFEWGYCGSGPAQLAFALLLDVFGPEIAERHYQDFKLRFVANLPTGKWEVKEEDVRHWIANAEAGQLL